MKKHISVAALTLRLTWVRALGLFAAVGVLQWQLIPGRDTVDSFQDYIYQAANIGLAGFLILCLLLMLALCKSGKICTDYTWRRLRIPEGWATVISGLVLSGWIVLYGAFQLAVCLGLYCSFNEFWHYGREYLMLSAFRAEYLHLLLPVAEPWALVRNVVFVLIVGNLLAVAAGMQRSGIPGSWAYPYLAWLISKLSSGGIATRTDDIMVMVFWIVLVILAWFVTWRGRKHEAS